MANWNALRAPLAEVDSSVTIAWDELDRLAGELPQSAYVHNAFWKGDHSGWPGFTTTSVGNTPLGSPVRIGVGTARDRAILEPSDRAPGLTAD